MIRNDGGSDKLSLLAETTPHKLDRSDLMHISKLFLSELESVPAQGQAIQRVGQGSPPSYASAVPGLLTRCFVISSR